jgi:S1-C subfamily serine protease
MRWLRALVPALLLATASVAYAATPTEAQDRAQLEKQLADARARLDDAARDVAELSQKLHGEEAGAAMRSRQGGPPRGAMLGINIGGDQNRADGVEVKGVSPAGPAEAGGLRTGDVIVAVDGKPLRKTADQTPGRQLVEHLRGVAPGQVVKVEYLRDGKTATASVKTSAAEPPLARVVREHLPMLEGMQLPPDFEQFLGGPGRGFRALELVPITPKLGQYFGTDKGLLVVRAPAEAGAKLEEGDVILTIGDRTPENPRHAFRILGSYQPGEKVKVELLRQRKRTLVDITVPERPAAAPMFHGTPPRAPVPPAAPPPEPRGGSVSS